MEDFYVPRRVADFIDRQRLLTLRTIMESAGIDAGSIADAEMQEIDKILLKKGFPQDGKHLKAWLIAVHKTFLKFGVIPEVIAEAEALLGLESKVILGDQEDS